MKKLIFSFVCLLSVSGCVSGNDNNDSRASITMPILSQCVDAARKTFAEVPEYKKIDANIILFDEAIWSHQDIVGYMEVSSSVVGYDGLKGILSKVVFSCFPMERAIVNKNQSDWQSELINIIQNLDILKIEKAYMVVDEKKIEIYSKSPELKRE